MSSKLISRIEILHKRIYAVKWTNKTFSAQSILYDLGCFVLIGVKSLLNIEKRGVK